MTRVVTVPNELNDAAFEALLADAAHAGDEKLLFDAGHVSWVDPYGMLGLLALGEYLRETGGRPLLQLPKAADVVSYLGTMGFLRAASDIFDLGDAARPRATSRNQALLPVTTVN